MAFTYVGGAANDGNASSASITHGLTIDLGDLVVAYVNRNDAIAISNDAGGSAWTEAMQETPSGETARHALFWKIAGASEPATYSWSLNGTDLYQAHLRVFSSPTDAVIDAAANTHIKTGTLPPFSAGAADGEVISDDAVSLIFAGMDRDIAFLSISAVDDSYVSILGDGNGRYTASAHRIYTTGTTFSGDIDFTTSGGQADLCYSVHISFVEGGGGGLTITPTGITSLEALGSPTLTTGAISVLPSAIESLEAFGSPSVGFETFIAPGAIASLETFGAHTIVSGAVLIIPSSILSEEVFPEPVLLSATVIDVSSIASEEAFGTTLLQLGAVTITPLSIASLEAFGILIVIGGEVIVVDARDQSMFMWFTNR